MALLVVDSTFAPVPAEPSVSSSLSVDKCAIEDSFDYFISVEFFGEPVYFVWDSIEAPTTSGLNFIGESRKTTTYFSGDSIYGRTVVDLKFSPIQTGDITMSDGYYRLLWIPNGDTTNIDTITIKYPGFAIVGLPKQSSNVPLTPILLIIVAIVFLIVLILILRKITQNVRKKRMKKTRPLSVSEKALDELSKISLTRNTSEQILDIITKTVRDYISDKYKISTVGLSSKEIIDSLERGGLGGHRLVALKKILNYCDDVRFAELYPEQNEIEEIFALAQKFVSE